MEQLANLSSGPFFVRLAGQSGFPRQVLFQTSKKEMPGNGFTPRWDPIRSTKISKLQYQYVFSHVRCNMVASEAGVLCYLCGGYFSMHGCNLFRVGIAQMRKDAYG